MKRMSYQTIRTERIFIMAKMNVLVIEPLKTPYTKTIDDSLESLQHEVDGYIECVYFFDEPVVIICNEEGKINGLKPNRALKDERGSVLDVIAGTFIMCGITDTDFCSLSDEYIQKFTEYFGNGEYFIRLGSKLIAVPADKVTVNA